MPVPKLWRPSSSGCGRSARRSPLLFHHLPHPASACPMTTFRNGVLQPSETVPVLSKTYIMSSTSESPVKSSTVTIDAHGRSQISDRPSPLVPSEPLTVFRNFMKLSREFSSHAVWDSGFYLEGETSCELLKQVDFDKSRLHEFGIPVLRGDSLGLQIGSCF